MDRSRCRLRVATALLALALLGPGPTAWAISLTLSPNADASLLEVSPDNSIGAQAYVLSGRTQNGPHVRTLYRFDLSALPTNALIHVVTLRLECLKRSSEPMCVADCSFGLHRMLRPWGEGTNYAAQSPGQGVPANPGDATWNNAFHPTNAWATPGGLEGVDFSTAESSFQYITSPDASPFYFESTPELVDDVQSWVRDPGTNHGWMMIANPEEVLCTARRFNSRESFDGPPQLMIEYTIPPTVTVLSTQTNPATGWFEQRVRINNHPGSGTEAVRLLLGGLAPNLQVMNACGFTNGVPYVQSFGTVPVGEPVEFVIDYNLNGGGTPAPVFTVTAAAVVTLTPVGAVTVQPIQRVFSLAGPSLLLQFATQSNRVYYVQFSSNLLAWQTAPPAITGSGNARLWLDHGQPQTDSAPGLMGARFYRVLSN